jgi:hypothetical protein
VVIRKELRYRQFQDTHVNSGSMLTGWKSIVFHKEMERWKNNKNLDRPKEIRTGTEQFIGLNPWGQRL